MRIVVDTNIVFSAMLNTKSKISYVLLAPKSGYNFYATSVLLEEIHEHSDKLKEIAGYSNADFNRILAIYRLKIKFIDPALIPKSVFEKAVHFVQHTHISSAQTTPHLHYCRFRRWYLTDTSQSSGFFPPYLPHSLE